MIIFMKRLGFISIIILALNFSVYANEKDSLKKEFYIPPIEYKVSVKDFILPASLLTAGVLASVTDHQDIISWGRSDYKSDDYSWDYLLLGGVAGSMFVFDRFITAENTSFDQSMLLLFSTGLSILPAYIVKGNYEAYRPDGGLNSFPSGHTTTGFMIAHVLNKEFRKSNPWVAYGGYVIASAVSISRVAMNKHWICDVLAGAGIGILGTELAYLIYFPVRNYISEKLNKKYNKEITLSPAVSSESLGLNLQVQF